MKKATLLVALSFISVLSFSQVQRVVTPKAVDSTKGSGGNMNEKNNRGDRKQMLRELNLTKEQRGKFKEMRQANEAKRDEINNNDSLTQDQKDAKLRELKRTQAQGTISILNDEQKAKAMEIRKSRGKGQQKNN